MKNRGISLIVLVITIVVIIILAAAVILTLGQNNPIANAKNARDKQSIATIEEEYNIYLSSMYVKTQGSFKKSTFSVPATGENSDGIKIEDVITSIKGTEYEGKVSINNGKIVIDLDKKALVNYTVVSENKTINGQAPSYNNPIIPVGFKAVDTAGANWNTADGWRNGLVIEDENGNQFVWIPVYDLGGTDKVEYKKNDEVTINARWAVTAAKSGDDTILDDLDETQQITKYSGFYVARYEASLPNELVNIDSYMDDLNTIQIPNTTLYYKPQSKYGGFGWNNISYANAKIVSENAYDIKSQDGNTTFVKSGLITGRQWDTMLKFISQVKNDDATGNGVNTNSKAWGNYLDTYPFTVKSGYYKINSNEMKYINAAVNQISKQNTGYYLLQTGLFGESTGEHPKNLYDVAGNLWEYTNEKVAQKGGTDTVVGHIIIRGGAFLGSVANDAPLYRRDCGITTSEYFYSIGFRVVLYIL